MSEPVRRVGLFGGSFDPIHLGHLCIAEDARDVLGLDRVILMPTWISPFKRHLVIASAADRLAMTRLATADNAHFEVSTMELEREGISYTVDTLRALHEHLGAGVALTVIMGADTLVTLPAWHKARALIGLARIAWYPRSGTTPDLAALERDLPGLNARLDQLPALLIDISSTAVRTRLAEGRSIRYLVPDAVCHYIAEHGLYGSNPPCC
ncbi:MAG: nicotinate (nicotinamide) nucleotide adenylyltransferase [Chloroflexi bacterium]|nr:nicotinate (nicotinamide) nucleotide adenylyltransferase [Chloroflexota bacterium]